MDRNDGSIVDENGAAPPPLTESARASRRFSAAILSVAALALCAAMPAAAESGSARSETQLLKQMYTTGLARIAQGDPARAVPVFQVISEVAPDLPQAHYSLALAMTLSDFGHRDRAMPELVKAMAADPRQPLYQVLRVMDDAALSTLGTDGALYLTADAAKLLREAAGELPSVAEAYNSRYLAPVLTSIQSTGDAGHPFRLPEFASMIGQNGTVRLQQFAAAPLAFGRLFALSVPEAQFAAHEGGLVTRLQNGLDSLSPESIDAARSRSRQNDLRRQLDGTSG